MKIDIDHFIDDLRKENIKTWFDIGLFLDRLKDKNTKTKQFESYEDFKGYIARGTAFINYYLSIDGVTIENIKYSITLKSIFPGIKIHWIQDHINPKQTHFNGPDIIKHNIKGLDGFEQWPPYMKLFHTKLKRGSKDYNQLILDIWEETLEIIENLLCYFNNNDITNMFITNVGSNPGNFALTLAIIIISEKLGMPVLNSNHDFYWEGGSPKNKRKNPRPRDHFFRNYDVGEVFSLQEQIYPWNSDKWMHLNINILQTKKLIKKKGINPNNIDELTTSIKTEIYRNITSQEKNSIIKKLNQMFNTKSYSNINSYNEDKLTKIENATPIVLGVDKVHSNHIFNQETILFLQPTRIIKRKNIEKDIYLIKEIINSDKFNIFLKTNKKINIVLLVSGPISAGNLNYYKKLIKEIKKVCKQKPKWIIKRLFFAFAFGKIKNKEFDVGLKHHELTISETYEIANFAMLPSETEGRGLPLLEASAAYTGIIASRYYPVTVFKRVIGEHLPESHRINIIEYPSGPCTKEFSEQIVQYLLDRELLIDVAKHNRKVIEKRFHYNNLITDFENAYDNLWTSTSKNQKCISVVKKALTKYFKSKKTVNNKIVYTKNRKYIPGYWNLEFMHYLKSLIDPSYFRVEEAELRGRVYHFCFKCMENVKDKKFFYECVKQIFKYYNEKDDIIFDHSFAFRHRNNRSYPYRKLTEQELIGVICIIMRDVFGNKFDAYNKYRTIVEETALNLISRKGGWNWALNTMSTQFVIDRKLRCRRLRKHSLDKLVNYSVDDRNKFIQEVVERPTHLIHFTGGLGELVIEMKVLGEKLLKSWSKTNKKFSVTFAAKKERCGNETTVSDIKRLLSKFPTLLKYYKQGIFKIISTGSLSLGVNLEQASKELIHAINESKKHSGVVTAKGSHNFFTLDCIDIHSYRFGLTEDHISSRLNRFARKKAYFEFVPAGFRTSYAYPVPFYRAKEVASILKSDNYQSLIKIVSEEKALKLLKEDMDKYGIPLKESIEKLLRNSKSKVDYTNINGVYKDGYPYNGVMAIVDITGFTFELMGKENKTEKVTYLAKKVERRTEKKVDIAWNGGYILNPELIGKLGLPEKYIGTHLGLVIKKGKVKSLPLYNKPVFAIDNGGHLIIKRARLDFGGKIIIKNAPAIEWNKDAINSSDKDIIIYDLLSDKQIIKANNRVILQFAGDKIAKVHTNERPYHVLPVGLIISVKKSIFNKKYKKYYKENSVVEFKIYGYNEIKTAIEAGPMLINKGKIAIDMKKGGWKTINSIRTQANRLDYTNLRGPKIAIGITKKGKLLAIVINGRIRESTGANYYDIARILLKNDVQYAMGFDPGGSATLVINGKQINISPYNSQFEDKPHTAPPEERKVSNAVIGYRI